MGIGHDPLVLEISGGLTWNDNLSVNDVNIFGPCPEPTFGFNLGPARNLLFVWLYYYSKGTSSKQDFL